MVVAGKAETDLLFARGIAGDRIRVAQAEAIDLPGEPSPGRAASLIDGEANAGRAPVHGQDAARLNEACHPMPHSHQHTIIGRAAISASIRKIL
jgi:hypothetical protein